MHACAPPRQKSGAADPEPLHRAWSGIPIRVRQLARKLAPMTQPGSLLISTRIAINGQAHRQGAATAQTTTGQFDPEQQNTFCLAWSRENSASARGLIILPTGVDSGARLPDRACLGICGTVVATGIIAWFAFRSFENIRMTLGVIPVASWSCRAVRLLRITDVSPLWIAIGLPVSRVQGHVSA